MYVYAFTLVLLCRIMRLFCSCVFVYACIYILPLFLLFIVGVLEHGVSLWLVLVYRNRIVGSRIFFVKYLTKQS